MDLEIREFSNSIINYINDTPLPIEVKRLVLRDICGKMDVAADGVIKGQIAERERAEKEKESGEVTGCNSLSRRKESSRLKCPRI